MTAHDVGEAFDALAEDEQELLWGTYHEHNSVTAGSGALYIEDSAGTRGDCLRARGIIMMLAKRGALVRWRRVRCQVTDTDGRRLSVRDVQVWRMPPHWLDELRRRDANGLAPPWVEDPDDDLHH